MTIMMKNYKVHKVNYNKTLGDAYNNTNICISNSLVINGNKYTRTKTVIRSFVTAGRGTAYSGPQS